MELVSRVLVVSLGNLGGMEKMVNHIEEALKIIVVKQS